MSGHARLSVLEVVLGLLVIAAFSFAVRRLLLSGAGPGAAPPQAAALEAESWAELALAAPAGRLPDARPADGPGASAVDVRFGPPPRRGLERVEVSVRPGGAGSTSAPDASRIRLTVVRLAP
jgi:hypothetical protein